MPSSDASARTCSSVSNITGPFLLLSSIGRIWLLKWPVAVAARRAAMAFDRERVLLLARELALRRRRSPR